MKKCLMVLAVCLLGARAHALETVSEPYRKSTLPIAPYQPAGATPEGLGGAAKPEEVAFSIEAGTTIRSALAAYLQAKGWTLAWEADDYVAQAAVHRAGDVPEIAEMVRKILVTGTGVSHRVVAYRANRVLRVFVE